MEPESEVVALLNERGKVIMPNGDVLPVSRAIKQLQQTRGVKADIRTYWVGSVVHGRPKTIVMLSANGKHGVFGVAECGKQDKFRDVVGIAVALQRALAF